MTERDPTHDHAVLEAQRQRSNVYAFRKIKWGDPRGRQQFAMKQERKPLSGLITVGLAALLGILAVALWVG